MHVNIVTLFQAVSGFKNNSHKSEWDGGDLRTCNFSWLDDITVLLLHFYTPWKSLKTFGFLKFSGGIEMKHWPKNE